MLEQGEYRAEALDKLLTIYTQEKEWEKAIEVARRLEHLSGRRMNARIAQFYCELGDARLAKADASAAAEAEKERIQLVEIRGDANRAEERKARVEEITS